MYLRVFAGLLMIVVFSATGTLVLAGDVKNKDLSKKERKIQKHSAKIRAGLNKLGTGKDSVVEAKLRNKKNVLGYVSEINTDTYTLIDGSGTSTVIKYDDTKKVKGNNLSSGAWIAIGFGIGMAVFGIVLWAVIANN